MIKLYPIWIRADIDQRTVINKIVEISGLEPNSFDVVKITFQMEEKDWP